MMIKKNKIPTILGILILLGGLVAGVFLLKNNQMFKIGATPEITPKEVRVASITDSSATISWVTSAQTSAFVSYGPTENVGTIVYETDNDQKFTTHSITITGLTAESNYFFKINSNGTTVDNNGIPWQFTTGKTLSTAQVSIPVSGSVMTASGEPSKRAIIYITVAGYTISSMTSDSGNYVLQLGSARTPDLSSYAQIDLAKTLLEVSATAENGEKATAKIFPQSSNPIPALIIGQDQDFRNLPPTSGGQNPNADLSLPEAATQTSKFNVGETSVSPTKDVTLKSITEGEIVTSDTPELFGEGPTGTKVTITLHSETPVTGTTTVSSTGSWNWSPPTNLSPGAHTVTLSWIDKSGITRTLTRNFVVQAGELPAFVATPSATPRTTSTPTPTPTKIPTSSASASPTVTKTPTPTAKASVSPTATPASLPKSGSLTPTLILSIMGLAVLAFSFRIWKLSEN